MLIEIKLHGLPGGTTDAKVTRIYKNAGSDVSIGEAIIDIEAGKNSMTIESTASGKVQNITVNDGDTVKPGQILAIIDGEKTQDNTKAPSAGFDYLGSLMKPVKQEFECDIAIIGGGPGGYVSAIKASMMGAKVILVEKERLGGTCLNWGCIPTKAFFRSAEVFKNLKNAETFGCYAENVKVDMKNVVNRKDAVVKQLVQGINYLLDKHKVKIVNGIGELQDNNTIYVKKGFQETIIKAKNIVIATGSKSSSLPIPGADLDNVIDSKQALQLDKLPEKMIIVGGGVIGMEFAFIFNSFGVKVTVIEFLDDILVSCDEDVCREIHKNAECKGIHIYTGSKVEEIINSEDGQCIVSFTKDGEKKYISADKILMAVGRVPNMEGIDTEKLGIELNDRGRGIKVNANMQTNIPNVYAIGDVTNKIQLAHVASHQGITAVKNILGQSCDMDYSSVPSAIFTDPEIAMVGVCEKLAKKEGIDVEIGKFPFAANGKALTEGKSEGFIKIVKEKSTGKVIGGAIIGPHAADLIAEITLAVKNQLTAEQISETIHAHPTTAEAVHEAALAVEGGSIHYCG